MPTINKTGSQKPYTFETLDPTQLAWLAGLLQAEADFTTDKRIRSKVVILTIFLHLQSQELN